MQMQFQDGQRRRSRRTGEVQEYRNGAWTTVSPPSGGTTGAVQLTPPDPRRALETERLEQQVGREPLEAEGQRLQNVRTQQQIEDAEREPQRRQQDLEDRRFQRLTGLREEFNRLPQVRDFNLTRDSVLQIQRLATSVPDNAPGRSQADLALVFAYMKALDPGSTVREGEAASAQNTAGVPEQIRIQYNRLLTGEALSPEIRQGMVRAAYDTYVARAGSYNELAQQYAQYFRELGEDPGRHIRLASAPLTEERRDLPQSEGEGAHWVDDPETGERMLIIGEGVLPPQNRTAQDIARFRREQEGAPGIGDLAAHGATLGLSDEARGVGQVIANAVSAPFSDRVDFDPVGSYRAGRDAERMLLDEARRTAGWMGTAAEIAGGFVSGRPSLGTLGGGPGGTTLWNSPVPNALLPRINQGARVGAGVGAVAGFGSGEGPQNSLVSTAMGAAGGGAIGAAAPALGAGANALYNVGRTALGRNPNLARDAISRAIVDDGNTPAAVGRQMAESQELGVPYMLADSGDNARGLLAASARAPGSARTLARDALDERQAGLGDRVTGAIERDLGPVSNPHQVADQLMEQARTNATPLYETFYSQPGADTFARRLGDIAERPAMRNAMNRAVQIAREEGRDPTTIGFDINEAGEAIAIRTPSWQTWDYVKRGLDDVLSAQPRDPATGRIIMDEGTRAIEQTRRQFLARADRANPHWAPARAAWSGPVRAREAMDLGRRALNMTADDMSARTRDLTQGEMEFFRLGMRRAMAERVANLGDTANVSRALLGTGRKRALLARLFGGREEFERFVRTLTAEEAGFQTYRTARLGSPTAPNIQDDAALANVVSTGMVDVATTGFPVTTAIRQAIRFGTGESGRKAQEQIAALLSEADPARLRELARELNREAARLRRSGHRASRRSTAYGQAGGITAGAAQDR